MTSYTKKARLKSHMPPTLVEDVKAFMRAGMDAEKEVYQTDGSVTDGEFKTACQILDKFRRLSEPSK